MADRVRRSFGRQSLDQTKLRTVAETGVAVRAALRSMAELGLDVLDRVPAGSRL